MCKVTWCNKETEYYSRSQKYVYCSTHNQYKIYGRHAYNRPHLMYKVEKVVNDDLKCEGCGYDARVYFPNRPLKQIAGLYDVDHINSNIKHTLKGEQPSNYQLLCKQCHILKSYDEGDFVSKNNRKKK